VLEVLYLLFNEGYGAHRGEALVRPDLVREAIRLARLVLESDATRSPKAHALLALFLLQGARLAARIDPDGRLRLLSEQDRSTWDADMISLGLAELRRAASGEEVTEYHLEAGVAACHAAAASAEATDWRKILGYYDALVRLRPDSPVFRLNRAVAVAMTGGPEAGLREIDALGREPLLARYYLLPATRAAFLRRSGDRAGAAAAYGQAIALAPTLPERRFLEARLAECSEG
jgi:RNA polymerase sigma-70 factor (ECF subfamily)